MTRQKQVDRLWPLVDRCHLGHCWIKTNNGPRRIDETFSLAKLNEHVTGANTYGLCPIAPGHDVTRAACLDFDSHKGETPWDQMRNIADTVCMTLEEDGHHPAMFRSGGGSGVHVYLLWEEPQDAHSVRQYLSAVLKRCGLSPGTKGVSSAEVEVFPKQDAVPGDGYGSMFYIPLGRATKSEHLYGELWAMSRDVPFVVREERKADIYQDAAGQVSEAKQADISGLKSALDAIPNSNSQELSYDDWFKVVCAVHHATDGSSEGLHLVHEFSQRASKYDGDFLDSRVWPYIRSDRDGALITERTLYTIAARYGWTDPELLDGFEVLEDGLGGVREEVGGGVAAGKASRFTIRGAAEARKRKITPWWVKAFLPRAELVVVYGPPGSGKSFFVLDLVAAIARGVSWRGKKTKQGRVLYIAAEGGSGFGSRIEAYCSHTQTELDQPQFGYIDGAPNLLTKDDLGELIQAIKAYGPVDLITIDTFSRVMPGGDENSSQDVGKAIAHCKVLHEVTGATVLLVHHSGKDASKGARGWSGLHGAADAEIEIVRSGDMRAATVSKQKDGEDGESLGFRLVPVPVGMDEDGDVVSSCIVEYTEDRPKAKARLGAKEQLAVDTLADLEGPDGTGPQVDELVSAMVDQMPFDKGSGKRDARRQHALRAIESLKQKGVFEYLEGRVQRA